jgi:hypothetical protein
MYGQGKGQRGQVLVLPRAKVVVCCGLSASTTPPQTERPLHHVFVVWFVLSSRAAHLNGRVTGMSLLARRFGRSLMLNASTTK